MGWPKGKPHGAQSPVHKAAISEGQRRRWADPSARARAIEGSKMCWEFGARYDDRVQWTDEMDAKLREMFVTDKWQWIRTEGARLIGVGDRTLLARAKLLGLRRSKPDNA